MTGNRPLTAFQVAYRILTYRPANFLVNALGLGRLSDGPLGLRGADQGDL